MIMRDAEKAMDRAIQAKRRPPASAPRLQREPAPGTGQIQSLGRPRARRGTSSSSQMFHPRRPIGRWRPVRIAASAMSADRIARAALGPGYAILLKISVGPPPRGRGPARRLRRASRAFVVRPGRFATAGSRRLHPVAVGAPFAACLRLFRLHCRALTSQYVGPTKSAAGSVATLQDL